MPYVCADLNLDEQLIHLSVAVHMAFFLYRDCSARTQFMPTQSYVDIMIMVKNMFYCVAKAKVDNPHGNFYPILLGTDRLEMFFGQFGLLLVQMQTSISYNLAVERQD